MSDIYDIVVRQYLQVMPQLQKMFVQQLQKQLKTQYNGRNKSGKLFGWIDDICDDIISQPPVVQSDAIVGNVHLPDDNNQVRINVLSHGNPKFYPTQTKPGVETWDSDITEFDIHDNRPKDAKPRQMPQQFRHLKGKVSEQYLKNTSDKFKKNMKRVMEPVQTRVRSYLSPYIKDLLGGDR